MSLSTAVPVRVNLAATAAQTVFNFTNILIFRDNDLQVFLNEVRLLTSAYTVTLNNPNFLPSDGFITLASPASEDDVILIQRQILLAQNTTYAVGGAFPAKSHEAALDKLTLEIQDARDLINLSPKWVGSREANYDWTYTNLPDAVTPYFPLFDPATKTVLWSLGGGGGGGGGAFADLTGTLDISGTDARILDITPGLTGAVARGLDERVREWYTVKDFGATGDGTTDDRAAFAACNAAANNGFVYVPAGTYRISSNLGLTNVMMGLGATFLIDSGFVLTITGVLVADQFLTIFTGVGTVEIEDQRPVYPEWWGADSTGVLDSQPAISAAINACQDNNVWVHFASGTYKVSSLISTTSASVKLTGTGQRSGASTLASDHATAGTIEFDNVNGPIIRDLRIAPSVTQTAGEGIKIFSTSASSIGGLVENVSFEGCFNGLEVSDASETSVNNCRFLGTVGTGVVVAADAAGLLGRINIQGCTFTRASTAAGIGVDIQSGRGINVMGCSFDPHLYCIRIQTPTGSDVHFVNINACSFDAPSYGIWQGVGGGYSHTSATNVGFNITGCQFNQAIVAGYWMDAASSGSAIYRGVVLSGNFFYVPASKVGVQLNAQQMFNVTGNFFRAAATSAQGVTTTAVSQHIGHDANMYEGFASFDNEFNNSAGVSRQTPVWLHDGKTWDPPSVAVNETTSTTVTVTGARVQDFAIANHQAISSEAITVSARVSAVDEVTVTIHNSTTGAVDIASGFLYVAVMALGKRVF